MPTNPTSQEQDALNNELQETRELALEIRNAFRGIGAEISDIIGQKMKNLNGSAKTVARTIREDIVKGLQSQARESDKINKLAEKQLNGSIKAAEVEARINKSKEIHLKIMDSLEEALMEGVINQDTFNKKVEEATKQFQKQQGVLKKMREQAELFEKKLGLSYKIFKGIADVPILGKFVNLSKVTEAMEGSVSKGASAWQAFGTGIGATLKSIGSSLTDPLVLLTAQVAIFTKLFKLAKELDQTTTNTARTLGISKNAAEDLNNSYAKYAANVGDSFLNSQMLLETQTKLNKELGTSVAYSAENLEGASRLSHFYGLSEQSSAKMVELGTEQGRNSLDILRSVSKTYTLQKSQLGGTMALNKVLDKVANVSDEIYTRFKGNPEAIAKAVMQANRLGLELDQVNKIGESLLDFESSIENELKAELLTGKAINLERARAAALSGDTAKLTTEIAKQVGSIHQFEKMNVIQRKAYAEAFGMNVQEMSSMLRKREFEAKLSEDAKKSATATLEYAAKNNLKLDDALKAQYEQKSLAEEQHEVFKNLNVLLANLTSGPMKMFLDLINKSLHGVQSIVDAFSSMTGGVLGNALGSVLLGAPLLIGAIRMIGGGIKAMFLGARGSSPLNPMFVEDATGGGGGGGITDMLSDFGGGGKRGLKSRATRGLVGKFGAKGARNLIRGAKGFGIGAAIGIGADLVAGQMDEGTGKDVVSGIGTTASWAGTGAMIGSIIPGVGTAVGAVVGGLAGAMTSLFEAETNRIEREKAEKQKQEEQQKATNDLMRQFLDRPVQLNVGGKTILDFNTASNLYGTQQSSFN